MNRFPKEPKPVERISLPEGRMGLRLGLAIFFLVTAAVAFTYGIMQFLGRNSGWATVEADSSGEGTVAGELTLQYDLGASGVAAGVEKRKLATLYTQLAQEAYRIFQPWETFSSVGNLAELNCHPNETVTVHPTLYKALSLAESQGIRHIYLAPLYEQYGNLFFCANDAEAAEFDPYVCPEAADAYREMAAFANDPASVRVELLGKNQVQLYVSEAYRAYASENGVMAYVDFNWMRNAFAVDYIADGLIAEGYTRGSLASFDGYLRTMDSSGTAYSLDLYSRVGQAVYPLGQLPYSGTFSYVALRDYPLTALDATRFYETASGEIRTAYVDPADGLSKSAIHQLSAYSREKSCAETLFSIIGLYVAEEWEERALPALKNEGIYAVFCRDYTVYYTQEDLTLRRLFHNKDVQFMAQYLA